VNTPLRILLSQAGEVQAGAGISATLGEAPWRRVAPGEDADIAFVTRDVTGLSTKHTVLPDTQVFYDGLLSAASLRWVHIHSAGADRPVFVELMQRGVALTTSSGANARIVVQTAVAGILALARRLPQLFAAQREARWAPLMGNALPRRASPPSCGCSTCAWPWCAAATWQPTAPRKRWPSNRSHACCRGPTGWCSPAR
jgi:uncharacterized membrane protein